MGLDVLSDPVPRLALLQPPYQTLEDIDTSWKPPEIPAVGTALVWWIADADVQEHEFQWLHDRAPGIALVIILPPARHIERAMPLVSYITALYPRAILPSGRLARLPRIRQLLRTPPQPFAAAVANYLYRRELLTDAAIRKEVRKIIELAPKVSSVSRVARRLYTSRRTLGRHLSGHGLPVPSHWLQFGRLAHVATYLQKHAVSVRQAAQRMGYPDGFTMSNQMKRLIGHRPSEVRDLLGWEWVVESWLATEARAGAFDLARHGSAVGMYISRPVES